MTPVDHTARRPAIAPDWIGPILEALPGRWAAFVAVAVFPTLFWTTAVHLIADALGHPQGAFVLAGIGLAIFALLICVCALLLAGDQPPQSHRSSRQVRS